MSPTFKRGDLAVVEKYGMNTYQVGDIVSFYRKVNGSPAVITHRIHAIGGNVYITKGDNNAFADREVLLPRLIIGKVIMIVPYLGHWVILLKSIAGRLIFIIFPMFLIIHTEFLQLDLYRRKNT